MSNTELALRTFLRPFAFFFVAFSVWFVFWSVWRLAPNSLLGRVCASFILKGPSQPQEGPSTPR